MSVSNEDLRALSEDLKSYIRERDAEADARNVERFGNVNQRIDGVNTRLDRVNGNIARHAASIAAGDIRFTNLEREVFPRPRRDDGQAPVDDSQKPALTKGDVKRALGVLAAMGVIVEALHRVGAFVFAAFKVAK